MTIQKQLKEKLDEIYDILKQERLDDKQLGILNGISGISLFHFYYGKITGDEESSEIGMQIIADCVDQINNGYAFPTYCSGIAGTGWFIEFLNQEGFIDNDNDDLLSELDEYLLMAMKNDITKEYYDFLHGALGYGYFFLKRYEYTKSKELKSKYCQYLQYLITALENSSKKEENKIWWDSELISDEGLTGCNLGLSHGISSIINFLSRTAEYKDFKESSIILLKGASFYLLSCKRGYDQESLFSNWMYTDMDKNESSRLAWCYGDLGIAISLYRAGKILADVRLQKEAVEIAKHSTKRKNPIEAKVFDAGFCHGSVGAVGIYQYFYAQTEESVFIEAAEFWIKDTLAKANHKDGLAGYMKYSGTSGNFEKEINLIEGIAGIGLSIISYLEPEEKQWNECFMIS